MWQDFINLSTERARLAFLTVGDLLIKLIGLLAIIVVGWIVAKAIRNVTARVLASLKVDKVAESTGINNFLTKGGIKLTFSEVIVALFYWLVVMVTVAVAVDFLGLDVIGTLLSNMILYIPSVIISIFILVFGIFVSTFLSALVQTAAANAGLVKAKLMSKIVEVVVIVFAILIALEQLRIASDIISFVIKAVIIGIAGAIALAFGLGCKDMAEKAIADWLEKLKEKK